MLRVEFFRHCSGNRTTLDLHESAPPVRSLWSSMACEEMRTAKEALSSREGWGDLDSQPNTNTAPPLSKAVLHAIQNTIRNSQMKRGQSFD